MEVGCIGDVCFEVSSREQKTFQAFEWKSSASYSTHDVVGEVGKLEYTGTDPDTATFTALISEYLGSDPMEEYETLRGYVRDRDVVDVVIGDMVIGNSWVVTDVSMNAKHFKKNGDITTIEAKITLSEYE